MGREGPTYLHEAPGLGKVPHDEPRAAPPRAREDVLPVAGDLHVEVLDSLIRLVNKQKLFGKLVRSFR